MLYRLLIRISFLGSVFLVAGQAPAQRFSVSIHLKDDKKNSVAFATTEVARRNDSNFLFKVKSDSAGLVKFNLPDSGQYRIKVTCVGYATLEKGILVSGRQSDFIFTMEHLARSMKAVVVTSQKPLIRQEEDKTIVDPENIAAASTNGYEVLEKTPGLFIDQDGNIYISSLTPAQVQINGHDMQMNAADMATLLKSLPPHAIQKIEIVRTPSAKYDASGTGGVVNVVLKKGFKIGITGSATAGMQHGTYGTQLAGFNLNNNNGKRNFNVNANYTHRDYFDQIITDRHVSPDTLLSQNSYTRYPSDIYFTGYSYSTDLNKKWTLDAAGSLSLTTFKNTTENPTVIEKLSTAQTLSQNGNSISNTGHNIFIHNSIGTKYKIDTLGSEWTNDVFYVYTGNRSDQDYVTNYSLPVAFIYSGNGLTNNNRNFWSAASDLKLKKIRTLTIEAGLKSTLLGFQNVSDYKKNFNGSIYKDTARTSTFHFHQNINAAYLQASKTFGKDIIIKAGLRLENTQMDGEQFIPRDTSFSIHRTDFFPYLYISKNIITIFSYPLRGYLVYRRSITRPGYDQLNPFPRYVDQYLTEAGNPSLRPQFTQNYEANISYDERPIIAIGINDTKDIFTNVVYVADSSHLQSLRTYDNLGKNHEVYFRALGALPPGKRYFFVLGTQYNHNFYQGYYEGAPLSYKKGTWTFFTFHTLRLDKRSTLTVNGFLRLKGQQQFYILSDFGQLNASINRKFWNEKLTLTMSVQDIFYTNKNNFSISQGLVTATGLRKSDTRRFGFNIRYNFGIRKKEENNVNPEVPEDR